MSIPEGVATELGAEAVGRFVLFDIDATEGHVRLLLGENGLFDDINGNRWYGSKLLSMGDVEIPRNGEAPSFQVQCSYTYDPDRDDLVSAVRQYGVSSVDGRPAILYFQYLGRHEEMFAPIWQPIRVATYTMRKLIYSFDGPQTRRLTLLCEGGNPLRGMPKSGRYTDADQQRRFTGDTSLEDMPKDGWDEQPLFGI